MGGLGGVGDGGSTGSTGFRGGASYFELMIVPELLESEYQVLLPPLAEIVSAVRFVLVDTVSPPLAS